MVENKEQNAEKVDKVQRKQHGEYSVQSIEQSGQRGWRTIKVDGREKKIDTQDSKGRKQKVQNLYQTLRSRQERKSGEQRVRNRESLVHIVNKIKSKILKWIAVKRSQRMENKKQIAESKEQREERRKSIKQKDRVSRQYYVNFHY